MNRFAVLRGVYGAILLLAPRRVAGLYTGAAPDPATVVVARVLGARQLAQAVLTAGAPGALVLGLGVEVDLAHSASMLALAVFDARRRRGGLVEAAVAGGFAAAGAVLGGRRSPAAAPRTHRHELPARLAGLRDDLATQIAQRTLPAPVRARLGRRSRRGAALTLVADLEPGDRRPA